MKKQIRTTLFLLLATVLTISSCKKEEITEVTNEYYTIESGAEIYTWQQSDSVILTIDDQYDENSWTLNELIGEIEIEELKANDILVVETQLRLKKGTDYSCTYVLNVVNGPFLRVGTTDLPDDSSIISIGTGPSTSEIWQTSENFHFFHRTASYTVESDINNAKIGLWANVISGSCADNLLIAQASSIVITVYRNN